jgi:hypothetical protein
MPESDPFQALPDEDRMRAMRQFLRLFASHWLGEPDKLTVDCLECIVDLDRLDRIYDRATEADSWQDLLNVP